MKNTDGVTTELSLSPTEFVEFYNRRIVEDRAADINARIIADYWLHADLRAISAERQFCC